MRSIGMPTAGPSSSDSQQEGSHANDASPLLSADKQHRHPQHGTLTTASSASPYGYDTSHATASTIEGRRRQQQRGGETPTENKHKKKFLSLDFDRVINDYSIEATKARQRQQPHHSSRGRSLTRWALTVLVGVCTGLVAVCIIYCVDELVTFRVNRLNRQMQWSSGYASEDEIQHFYSTTRFFDIAARRYGFRGVYVGYSLYNLLLCLTSTALCVLCAPDAVGSGIPEVKAYLNGIRVGTFADLRLFGIKILGTILAVSSGLVVGPEGPVVHIGAIVGASMTKACMALVGVCGCRRGGRGHHPDGGAAQGVFSSYTTISSTLTMHLSNLRNDLEQRKLISIGAAAGFAAAFGAPVGGLLYSMEEASSFFAHDMLWKTLTATCCATLCIAVYYGDLTRYCMLSFEIVDTSSSNLTRFGEAPLYVVCGVLGGLLGATFNNTYRYCQRKRKVFYGALAARKGTYLALKMTESATLSVLTSVLMLTLPLTASWACRDMNDDGGPQEDEFDPGFLHRYNCAPGQINEIGSILFGSREESIKDIFTNPEEFAPETLLSVGILFLSLMMITFGVALPTGMFMPTVLTGASLGGYAGIIFKRHFIPSVHPADFALIGAAGFLAGMQRNTVSLCVILMEGTGQTKVLIPVIITVVCARTVGDLFSEGVYEIGMELKEYPYLSHETNNDAHDMFAAKDVMDTTFQVIRLVETAQEVQSLLLSSDAHAFPVVNDDGKYKGMVRRDQLVVALQCKIFVETLGRSGGIQAVDASSKNGRRGLETRDVEQQETSVLHHDRPSLLDQPFQMDYDIFRTQKFTRKDHQSSWDPNKPATMSPWLREHVITSDHGNEIVLGMDDTLPDGVISNESKTIVKVMNDKVIALIPPSDRDKHVAVGSIMNRSALSVMEDCPLSRTYDLFCSMGLRHLPVLGDDGRVVGIVTRHNLSDEFMEERTNLTDHS